MSEFPRSHNRKNTAQQNSFCDPVELKRAQRAEFRRSRRERSEQQRAALSAQMVKHALGYPELVNAHVVASFEPLPTEPNIAPLNVALLERGITVLIPVMLADKDLTWRSATADDDLGKNAIARADVILTPALALGPHGERLGQGGGSYDRALPRRRADAQVIGVVWGDDLDRDVICEEHDERVHASLSEHGLRRY